MIKFLINLASLLVCLGILAVGGIMTVQAMQIDEMIADFEAALDKPLALPTLPEKGFEIEVPNGSSAILNENTTLKADKVTEELSDSVKENISSAVGDDKESAVLVSYDISLLLDGASVQPGGAVLVTLPAPENMDDYDSLAVVYIADDGSITLCDTTVNADRTVSFLTDHFSRYAIIGLNEVEESVPEHTHRFIAGKCECGEEDPNYVPPHVHEFINGECSCGEVDPNYKPPHVHKYVEGKCECGEINPTYKPHAHTFVEGKCECGESDPNYVPPHVHKYVEGICSCGEKNPYYHWHSYEDGWCSCGAFDPAHVHSFTEGKCPCGESDPNYKPGLSTEEAKNSFSDMYNTYDPDFKELNKEFFLGMVNGAIGSSGESAEPEEPVHTHRFIAGKCECGEEDPNYVPPHVHEFIEGECSCGEVDPNYVPPHVHKYVEGKCECGEINPTYKPHVHTFVEGKCECGESDPNYVPPHVHKYVEGICSCGAKNPEYHWHKYEDGWCSCGAFDPAHVHAFTEGKCACGEEDPDYISSEEVNELIVGVAGTYFDKLQEGIENNINANKDATEEEKQAAQEAFVQKESDAFAGLLNVVTKPEETTDDQLVDSVGAILDSSVCLDTVTESVQNNEKLTTTVQDATAGMNEETKTQIEDKINEALAANPEMEQQYNDLANLFGITLGGSIPEIPGDIEIPGLN